MKLEDMKLSEIIDECIDKAHDDYDYERSPSACISLEVDSGIHEWLLAQIKKNEKRIEELRIIFNGSDWTEEDEVEIIELKAINKWVKTNLLD